MTIHIDNGSTSVGGGGTTDHSALTNLSFTSAGHTGFQADIGTDTTSKFLRGDLVWTPLSTAGVTDHAALTNLDFPSAGHVGTLSVGTNSVWANTFSGNTVNAVVLSGTNVYAGTFSGGTVKASGITCGTLQGVVISTGGSFSGLATGAVGQFLYQSGANVYGWANTSAVGGLGTDVVVPYVGAISSLVLGKAFSATSITCGTLQGVIVGTGGTFTAVATDSVGKFLAQSGANTYAWFATSAGSSMTTGILSANAPITTSGLSHVATAAQTISITTAIVAISAPLSTSAVFTTITAAQTLSITTGVLTANPPLTTSAVWSVLGGAKTLGITTAVMTVSAPLTTSAVWTTLTAAQTLAITTGVLTANPPLTTSTTWSILGAAKTLGITTALITVNAPLTTSAVWTTLTAAQTVGITTAIVSIVAPLSTSAVFTCLSAAQTLSINTATIWATTLSSTNTYSTYFSGGTIGVGAITCGTLQGVVISTGGSFSALATGAVGAFLAQSGANVYGWFNTSAAGGLGTDVVVPYAGAVSDLILNKRFMATGITCGTLQGVIVGTGGTISAVATGGVGTFFTHSGNNVYVWANTAAQAGLGTDVIVPYLGAVTSVNLGNNNISAYSFSASSTGGSVFSSTVSGNTFVANTFSGGTFLATTLTCGTLQGVVIGSGGSFSAIATGAVGKFLAQSGANTYAWFNTAAQAGLGTDVVVPYIGAVSDINLGSQNITATIVSAGTVNANIFSGGNLTATGITAGTLQGAIISTGGSFSAVATGAVGTFFSHSGGNVYVWANTQASLPTVTTGIISGLLPITTDNTRYALGGAVQLSLNTANIWATTFSGTTVLATTLSGTICRVGTMNVPSSATPILKNAGEVAVDSTTTTGSAFHFYSDAQYCLPVYYSKSFVIVNPAGVATYMLWKVPYAITLRNAYAYCAGGTVQGALYECDENGATATTATVNANITGTTTTSCNIVNAGIHAGDFIDWITTTTGGTPTQLSCTFYYTMDTG